VSGVNALAVVQQLIRRSGAAKASLWAVALTDAAAVLAGLAYARYLQSLDPISKVEELELVTSELAYTLVGLAQLAALIIAAVFFIRWFHLAHHNLGRLSDQPASHNSRWVIWGFFVPILNLVRPQQLMREIWSITGASWQGQPSRVVGLTQPADHVNLWWGLFLTTGFLGNAVGRFAWHATTAQETLLATWATVFADAFDIAAVLVASALVRSVTELQRPLLGHAPAGPAT
jgi:hypothetical protein